MTPLLIQGTALALPLQDASCHVCVTSPPYLGLRDYQTGTWQGGDAACTHVQTSLKPSLHSTLSAHGDDGGSPYLDTLSGIPYRGVCGHCGATRVDAQLGLEESVEEYVAAMVQVFREVYRVLRPDGTLWLNMGDSYASSGMSGLNVSVPSATFHGGKADARQRERHLPPGLPAKNLLGMPWRVAFALQQDGWTLRADIIWDKPSCMPESVQDRPTRSHEYIFLFSKQARYFYDAEAVRETVSTASDFGRARPAMPMPSGIADGMNDKRILARLGNGSVGDPSGRNARTVWRIASEPLTGFQHYAAFPTALVRRCLLAGAPTQVCRQCGAPWRRDVERTFRPMTDRSPEKLARASGQKGLDASRNDDNQLRGYCDVTTTGFSASCPCTAGTQPATVLDIFCGSGTTLLVARELGHHAIGIDLSAEYLRNIARVRLGLTALKEWQDGAAPRQDRFDDLPLFGG